MRQVLLHAHDAEIQIHLVVVRGDVAIADRPIFAETVATLGLEVVVGEAQRQPSPDICFSAQTSRAHPRVVRARERILALVNNNIFDVIAVPDVAAKVPGLLKACAVGRIANGVFVEGQRMRLRREVSAVSIVVRPLHRAQFLFDGQLFPGLQQQHLQAVRGEDVCGHAAGRARADNYRIVSFAEIRLWFRHRKTPRNP